MYTLFQMTQYFVIRRLLAHHLGLKATLSALERSQILAQILGPDSSFLPLLSSLFQLDVRSSKLTESSLVILVV